MLMIFHHFFLDANIFIEDKFPVRDFLSHPETVEHWAWAARCCVGLFAFLSGFGMFHLLHKKTKVADCCKTVGPRILKLYGRLFLVILLGVVLPRLLLSEPLVWTDVPGNLLAYDPTWNGSWWYVLEYLWMLILAPVLWFLFDTPNSEDGKIKKMIMTVILVLLWAWVEGMLPITGPVTMFVRAHVHLVFLYVFTEGYLIAALQERGRTINTCWKELSAKGIPAKKERGSEVIMRWWRFCLGCGLLLLAVFLRYVTTHEPSYAKIDVVAVPLMCWGCSILLNRLHGLERVLSFVGRYSLYMWLTHVLIFERTLYLLSWKGGPVVFYLGQVLMALLISLVLTFVERVLTLPLKKIVKKFGKKVSK